MDKPTRITDVFDKNQYDLATAAKKSQTWFNQQVLLMQRQGVTANKVMSSGQAELVAAVQPGRLYMFFYDPKLKKELPYYDRFPLVFPFSKAEGGFLGLNMHYLPYKLRVQLLDRLMSFKNNNKLDETTRLKYSWALIEGISKYAQPCVKHYLMDHVRSPFRKISSEDWTTAMLLPVEKFQKASKEVVWSESKRMVR